MNELPLSNSMSRQHDPLKPLIVFGAFVGVLTISPIIQFLGLVTVETLVPNVWAGPPSLLQTALLGFLPAALISAAVVGYTTRLVYKGRVAIVTATTAGLLTVVVLILVGPVFTV